jgi:hypothetical protein
MKQKLYILGYITLAVIIMGVVFKVNHFPGAGYMLIAGITTFTLIFMPLALADNYKSSEKPDSKLFYIVTWLTVFVVFTAMLFKIQHWQYAGLLLAVSLPFPYLVFLPVFLATAARREKASIFNTVMVLLLLVLNTVFSGLLSFGPSKELIDDSYEYPHSLNYLEASLKDSYKYESTTSLGKAIDEALLTIGSYQELILEAEGLTVEEWEMNKGRLNRPDSKAVADFAIINSGDFGVKLYNELNKVTEELELSNKFSAIAVSAPYLLGYFDYIGNQHGWAFTSFSENNLLWAMTYLDGLQTNLLMIKALI